MNLFRDKKIVVTGGSGMIGTHMISKLLELGAEVKTHTHKPVSYTHLRAHET